MDSAVMLEEDLTLLNHGALTRLGVVTIVGGEAVDKSAVVRLFPFIVLNCVSIVL